jgi:cytoskeletal protein RodZ
MKIKYYLRGLGFGLLGAALILIAVQAISGKSATANQSITQQETTGSVLAYTKTDAAAQTTAAKTEGATEQTDTQKATQSEQTTEAVTGTENTNAVESTSATQPQSDAPVSAGENVMQIHIIEGCTATQLADMLSTAGVIEDREGFIQYLSASGNSTKLRTGYFDLTKGDSFENIAAVVTRKN